MGPFALAGPEIIIRATQRDCAVDLEKRLTNLDGLLDAAIVRGPDTGGIANSAVSRRLGELEQRLGSNIVHRSSRSFEQTAVGCRYCEGARKIKR